MFYEPSYEDLAPIISLMDEYEELFLSHILHIIVSDTRESFLEKCDNPMNHLHIARELIVNKYSKDIEFSPHDDEYDYALAIKIWHESMDKAGDNVDEAYDKHYDSMIDSSYYMSNYIKEAL